MPDESKEYADAIAKKELLPEVKNVYLDKCVDCLAGKESKADFHHRPPMRRKNALEPMDT